MDCRPGPFVSQNVKPIQDGLIDQDLFLTADDERRNSQAVRSNHSPAQCPGSMPNFTPEWTLSMEARSQRLSVVGSAKDAVLHRKYVRCGLIDLWVYL